MLVFIDHPSLGPQSTRLAADVAADATSSTVENYTGFVTNDYVIFGKPGEEKSEIVLLTSATAVVTHASPFTWANGDSLYGTLSYEIV